MEQDGRKQYRVAKERKANGQLRSRGKGGKSWRYEEGEREKEDIRLSLTKNKLIVQAQYVKSYCLTATLCNSAKCSGSSKVFLRGDF